MAVGDVVIGPALTPSVVIPQAVRLAADTAALTATALEDVAGLSFPVTAGRYYSYVFRIIFQTAAVTTGLRVGISGPSVARQAHLTKILQAADGVDAHFEGSFGFGGGAVVSTDVPTANADWLATLEGAFVPNASGTIQFRAATEVAASGVIIRQGSMGLLWEVA